MTIVGRQSSRFVGFGLSISDIRQASACCASKFVACSGCHLSINLMHCRENRCSLVDESAAPPRPRNIWRSDCSPLSLWSTQHNQESYVNGRSWSEMPGCTLRRRTINRARAAAQTMPTSSFSTVVVHECRHEHDRTEAVIACQKKEYKP